MAEERDVWDSARNMIERYGDDALRQVGLRVQELEKHGQEEAHSYWLQIGEAVKALQLATKDGRKH